MGMARRGRALPGRAGKGRAERGGATPGVAVQGNARRGFFMSEFNEALVKEARKYARFVYDSGDSYIHSEVKEGFEKGAHWGFQMACDRLSSDKALAHDYQMFCKTERSLSHKDWADWLLAQRGER